MTDLIAMDGGLYRPDQVQSNGLTAAQNRAARIAEEHRYVRQQQTGARPDPLAEIGLVWSLPVLGDGRSQMRREIATEDALASQRVHCAIAPGATVTLANGQRLVPGDEVTPEHLDNNVNALIRLAALGVVLRIPQKVAWVRSLPSDVGPFVWAGRRPRQLADGGMVSPGETVTEEMFAPAQPPPKPMDPVAEMLAIQRGVHNLVGPGGTESEFDLLVREGKIVENPNFSAKKVKR